MNKLTIKVFEMDYSFLLKNYLNPEMWQKTWTLFEYKNFKVTLELWSIRTKEEKLLMEVKVIDTSKAYINSCTKTVDISLKIDDISFLKRKINTAIWEAIQNVEQMVYIFQEDEYTELTNMIEEERRELKKIANNFLDENKIENSNVREAYIAAYVDEYEHVYDIRNEYVQNRRYHAVSDFYLIWLESLPKDDHDKEIRLDYVKSALSTNELRKVLNEIEEYKSYMTSEQFKEDMKSNLEEV